MDERSGKREGCESVSHRHDDVLASINAKLRIFAESLTPEELAFLADEKMTYLDDLQSGVRVLAGNRRLLAKGRQN